MTKRYFLRVYEGFSAADGGYIYVVIRNHKVYMYNEKTIKPRYAHQTHECSKKGGGEKYMINIPAKDKNRMAKNGIYLCTEEEFMAFPYTLNGHKAEALIHQYFGQTYSGPDRVPFDVDGDITVDDMKYQIKFQNATITTVSYLHKVQAKHRKCA